jgi:hypothetical protein
LSALLAEMHPILTKKMAASETAARSNTTFGDVLALAVVDGLIVTQQKNRVVDVN